MSSYEELKSKIAEYEAEAISNTIWCMKPLISQKSIIRDNA